MTTDYKFIGSTMHSRIEQLPEMNLEPGTDLNDRYLETISRVMNGISVGFPEFVGFNYFGSLARNEAKVKADGSLSDIDGVIIIDADQTSFPLIEASGVDAAVNKYPSLTETILGVCIREEMYQDLKRVSGIDVESDRDILVVSEELLVDRPKRMINEVAEPTVKVTDWRKTDKDVASVFKYFIGRDQTAGLFLPTAFGDLDEYRRQALLPLAEFRDTKPQITSQIWNYMRTYVNAFQIQQGSNDQVTELPLSVDEALWQFVG